MIVHHVRTAPAGAVYIGRAMPRQGLKASPWANPFKIEVDTMEARIRALWAFRGVLYSSGLLYRIHELKGQDVACWCNEPDKPRLCHGHLLAAYESRLILHGTPCPACKREPSECHRHSRWKCTRPECVPPVRTLTSNLMLCSNPDDVAEYWRCHNCNAYGFEARKKVVIDETLMVTNA